MDSAQTSILTSVKLQLGIMEEFEHFDVQIVMAINTALATLTQLGVGPEEGFSIVDKTSVWTDFIQDDPNLEPVKTYVGLKVRLLFDPPQSQSHIAVIERQLSELEWRLNITAEMENTI